MTEPGGATGVGGIIGYLQLNREDWVRGVRESERDADRLGRLNPRISISTNAGDVIGQLALVSAAERRVGQDAGGAKPFVVNLWAALAAVAPAALPIAAVAGGALIGLVPLAAAAALGIAGINDELKSGQLAGTRYGKDVEALGTEFTKLKTIAAGGLLSGLDRGLANSAGLFTEINKDTATMSAQLGDIAGSGGPALLRILTQLNPLFETFGLLVDRGAHGLDDWSKSSDGVSHFIAYVQAELPAVLHFLGELGTLFSHIAQAAAPLGGVILGELSLLIHLLNSLPIGVLQTAIPVVVALYAAFKTYGAVTAIIAGVNNAINSMKAPFATTAAVAATEAGVIVASSQAVALAAADEAAQVARAKATEATAAAEAAAAIMASSGDTASLFEAEAVAATGAAAEITASWQGVASLFATDSTIIAEAAAAQAASFQSAAAAAVLSAEEIAAASAGASEAIATAGATARVGWIGLLGPLAAVGIGLALLTSFFGSNSDAAQHNQEIMDGYAQSLKQNADALAKVNLEQTAKNLQDEGAIALADKLSKNVSGLGLDYGKLTLAVNGSEAQFSDLYVKLLGVADAGGKVSAGTTAQLIAMSHLSAEQLKANYNYDANGRAAIDLAFKIKTLRGAMTEEMKIQEQLNLINRESVIHTNGGASATERQARALGLTRDAYLDAQIAAQKNTEQTEAQTAAWQLANAGGSLLLQTLDRLAGKSLSYAQAKNSFEQQLLDSGAAPSATVDTAGPSARRATAVEAEAVAQQRYNAAVAKGDPAKIASAHLALTRARNALTSATNALAAAEDKNAKAGGDTHLAVRGKSAEAVAERGRLISQVQTAEQAAKAYGDLKKSTEAGRQKLVEMRQAIIDNAVAQGANRKVVAGYLDTILIIPAAIAKASKTPFEVQTTAAQKKIDTIQARIDRIKQGKEPHLAANSVEANGVIDALQLKIDKLRGKTVKIDVLTTVVSKHTEAGNAAAQQSYLDYLNQLAHKAAGGPITGPGAKGVDSVPIVAAPGEWMLSAPAVDKLTALIGTAGMRSLSAGVVPTPRMPAASSASPVSSVHHTKRVHVDSMQVIAQYPEPERVSTLTPRALAIMANQLGGLG